MSYYSHTKVAVAGCQGNRNKRTVWKTNNFTYEVLRSNTNNLHRNEKVPKFHFKPRSSRSDRSEGIKDSMSFCLLGSATRIFDTNCCPKSPYFFLFVKLISREMWTLLLAYPIRLYIHRNSENFHAKNPECWSFPMYYSQNLGNVWYDGFHKFLDSAMLSIHIVYSLHFVFTLLARWRSLFQECGLWISFTYM